MDSFPGKGFCVLTNISQNSFGQSVISYIHHGKILGRLTIAMCVVRFHWDPDEEATPGYLGVVLISDLLWTR